MRFHQSNTIFAAAADFGSRLALLCSTSHQLADRHRTPAPAYKQGQRVWLSSKNIPLKTDSRKLSPRYLGPFESQSVINPVAVRLRLPSSLRVHPVFHVSRLKPVVDSPLCSLLPGLFLTPSSYSSDPLPCVALPLWIRSSPGSSLHRLLPSRVSPLQHLGPPLFYTTFLCSLKSPLHVVLTVCLLVRYPPVVTSTFSFQ